MEVIYIKKQASPNAAEDSRFIVPAIGLNTREGTRLIPHPYGTETTTYESLEQAIEQIHRAGYAAEYDGTHYPLPIRQAMTRSVPRRISSSQSTPTLKLVENAIPSLLEQLSDHVPSVVASAAFALGEIRDEGALPGLIHALGHEDSNVRKNATEALAKIGKPVLKAVQLSLKDKHWLVRHSALCVILELLHYEVALVPIILPEALPLLKDENWLVRSHAATVFGEVAKTFRSMEENQ
jgi:HEAT repeats/HEAT repeat